MLPRRTNGGAVVEAETEFPDPAEKQRNGKNPHREQLGATLALAIRWDRIFQSRIKNCGQGRNLWSAAASKARRRFGSPTLEFVGKAASLATALHGFQDS